MRLLVKQEEGGQGLESVKATVQEETAEIHRWHLSGKLISESLRKQKSSQEEDKKEEEASWIKKPMHSTYRRLTLRSHTSGYKRLALNHSSKRTDKTPGPG